MSHTQTTPHLKDYAAFYEMMRANEAAKPSLLNVSDVIMKISVAICTAGILWLVTSVSDLQHDMTKLSVEQSVTEDALKRLDAFAQKPRFTYEDFRSNIEPLKQDVARHSAVLNDYHSRVSLTDSRLATLESRLDVVLKKLEEISDDVKEQR